MTGEISLQGLVLPVGGIKEKCMAAHRNQIKNVILPEKNRMDAEEIPEDLRSEINIHFVKTIDQALELALEDELDMKYLKKEILPFMKAKLWLIYIHHLFLNSLAFKFIIYSIYSKDNKFNSTGVCPVFALNCCSNYKFSSF